MTTAKERTKTTAGEREKIGVRKGTPSNDSEMPRVIKVLHEISHNLKPLISISTSLSKIHDQLEISNKLANIKIQLERERHLEQMEHLHYEEERAIR